MIIVDELVDVAGQQRLVRLGIRRFHDRSAADEALPVLHRAVQPQFGVWSANDDGMGENGIRQTASAD